MTNIIVTFKFHNFLNLWQGPGIYRLLLLLHSFRVFHTRKSWRVFTGVWVNASLLRGLQESSQYFCQFQQWCSLDDFDLPSDFQSLLQTSRDNSKDHSNYYWNHRHCHVLQLFLLTGKVQIFFFALFYFHFDICWNGKVHMTVNSLFSVWSSDKEWVICLYIKIPNNYIVLIL